MTFVGFRHLGHWNTVTLCIMAKVHHLTRTALERLQAEHADLTTRGRIEVAEKIERARELGDLSENGDYHAAKDEQATWRVESATSNRFSSTSRSWKPMTATWSARGKLVTLSIDGDEPETYYLGSHEEQFEGAATMTPESALGQAITGKSVNETCSYTTPNGDELSVVVISVELPDRR